MLVVRVLDRIGKGIRTAPRDALIADVTAPEARGRAFGFNKAMDKAADRRYPSAKDLADALQEWAGRASDWFSMLPS